MSLLRAPIQEAFEVGNSAGTRGNNDGDDSEFLSEVGEKGVASSS